MRKIAKSNLFKKPLLEILESRWVPTVRVISSFEGMNDTGYFPPDTNLAVGPNHAIEVVNASIAIYNKTDGKELMEKTIASFMPSNFYSGGLGMFDPIVMYDDIDQRFVVVVHVFDDSNKKSFIDFAVSKNSDPTQGFVEFIEVETSELGKNWVDNGKIGFNGINYVFSGNVYSISNSDPYPDKSIIISVDKKSVLDNNPATATYYSTYRSGNFGLIPARMHGATTSDPQWFARTVPGGGNSVQVTRADNILSNSPAYTDTFVSVAAYTNSVGGPQPGSSNVINTSDCRTQSVEWNNGRLVSGYQTAMAGDATAVWAIFSATATATPALIEEGRVRPAAGIATSFPGPTLDSFGNLGITYLQSSANEFLSMYVSGKSATEPKGVLQTPVLVMAGTALLTGQDGSGRWRAGDYAGICPDPVDGTFWAAHEYASAGVTGNWKTRIANFTVSKAQVISFSPLNPVVYGVAPITLNATGGLSGNPVIYSVISGPGIIQGNKLQVTGAGTIVVEANQAGNLDYLAAQPVRQSLVVLQAPLTVSANDTQKDYAAALPAFTFSFTGFVNNDGPGSLSNLGAITNAVVASPVGVYRITPAATNPNYLITLVEGKLKVVPAALTITADNQSKLYGSTLPLLTTTVKGLASFDSPAVIAGLGATTIATASSPVGSYDIVPTGTNSNYSITYVSGILSVTRADLVLSADNKLKVYGDLLPNLTSTLSGLVNGDSASLVTGINLSTTALASSSVGDFPISVSGVVNSQNYKLILVPGKLSVTQAVLTLKADDKTKLYGTDNPAFTVTLKGLVNGDQSTIVTGTGGTTTALISSSVGTYPIVPLGTINSLNYTLSLENGTLTVNTTSLTITAEEKSKVYGAQLPPLTVIVKGLVNGDKESSLIGLGADSTGNAASSVGTYIITPRGSNPNYTIKYVTANLIVTPAQLTIKADDKSRVYGAKDPVFSDTFIGLVNGDTPASVSGISNVSSATEKSSVGNYSIIPTGSNPNYLVTFVTGKLLVTPAPLKLTADNKTKVYGAPSPILTSTASGVLSFDKPDQIVTALTGIFPVKVDEKTSVGTYAIEPAATLLSPNYFIDQKINGTIAVTPAALSITADSLSKLYGAQMPPLTYVVKGLVNGDPQSIITGLGVATKARDFSDVGTYPIFAQGSTLSPNYTVELVAGSFQITKASLVITAFDQKKVYGAAMPTLTTQVTGLVNFDSLAAINGLGATTVGRFYSPAGNYEILPAGTNPNYDITLVKGLLNITKAPLVISVANATKDYGANLPDLKPVVTGLVNGDTINNIGGLGVSTLAKASSPVGNYPLTAAGTNLNYDVSLVNGNLAINPVSLTITADSKSKVYGDNLPKLTTSLVGLVNGDTPDAIQGLGATTTALSSSKVGTYKISPAGVSSNYKISLVEGVLSVTKASLAIVADDQTYTKGIGSFPTLTYKFDKLVNGDKADALTGSPVLSTTATPLSDFGPYPVSVDVSKVTSDNYQIVGQAGKLTIIPVANPVIPVGVRPAMVTLNGAGTGISIYDGGKKIGAINPFPGYKGSIQTAMADVDSDGILDIIAATGSGIAGQVKFYTGRTLELIKTISPYGNSFRGGITLTAADLNGDKIPEIITGTLKGSAPNVKMFKADGTALGSFFAYAQNSTFGVNVATGDFNLDGKNEIVTWPFSGGTPNVKIFDGTGGLKTSFFAYPTNFTGGFSLVVGDVSGDSKPEIVTGSGPGMASSVRVFDGSGQKQGEWNPYGTTQIPVLVALANLDGSTKSTIVTALGVGGSSVVKNYTGQGGLVSSVTAYTGNFRSGLSLAVATTNGGKKQELVVGPNGSGASPQLKRFGSSNLELIDSVFAADANFLGGLGLS